MTPEGWTWLDVWARILVSSMLFVPAALFVWWLWIQYGLRKETRAHERTRALGREAFLRAARRYEDGHIKHTKGGR